MNNRTTWLENIPRGEIDIKAPDFLSQRGTPTFGKVNEKPRTFGCTVVTLVLSPPVLVGAMTTPF